MITNIKVKNTRLGEGTSHYIYSLFIHFVFVYMLNTNQLEHILTNPCIHLSYLEDQRNLKIYNNNFFF